MSDIATNQQLCDPELDGCGTIFTVTLTRCPHCQRHWGTEDFFANPDGEDADNGQQLDPELLEEPPL